MQGGAEMAAWIATVPILLGQKKDKDGYYIYKRFSPKFSLSLLFLFLFSKEGILHAY